MDLGLWVFIHLQNVRYLVLLRIGHLQLWHALPNRFWQAEVSLLVMSGKGTLDLQKKVMCTSLRITPETMSIELLAIKHKASNELGSTERLTWGVLEVLGTLRIIYVKLMGERNKLNITCYCHFCKILSVFMEAKKHDITSRTYKDLDQQVPRQPQISLRMDAFVVNLCTYCLAIHVISFTMIPQETSHS